MAANYDVWSFRDAKTSLAAGAVCGDAKGEIVNDPASKDGPYLSLAPGAYFRCDALHAAASSGGHHLNRYTLFIDFRVPHAISEWCGVYQTNTTNANESELYLNKTGGVGVKGVYSDAKPGGTGGGAQTAGVAMNWSWWHRLAVVLDDANLCVYVDGAQVLLIPNLQATDGRWAIDKTGRFYLFGSHQVAEMPGVHVRGAALIARALTPREISAFGGDTTHGITFGTTGSATATATAASGTAAAAASTVSAAHNQIDAKSQPAHTAAAATGSTFHPSHDYSALPEAPGSVLYDASSLTAAAAAARAGSNSSEFPHAWDPKRTRVFIVCLARFAGEKDGATSFSLADRTDLKLRDEFEARGVPKANIGQLR